MTITTILENAAALFWLRPVLARARHHHRRPTARFQPPPRRSPPRAGGRPHGGEEGLAVSDSKKLCPFKKDIERSIEKRSGKVTMRERFAPCAKEKCMAYDRHREQCRRLEAQK